MRAEDVQRGDPLIGPCALCGQDVRGVPVRDLGATLAHTARRWATLLETSVETADGSDAVRQRPQPDVWSVLEYACHVRDVLSFAHHDLHVVLADPSMGASDFDGVSAAASGNYREQMVDAVAADVVVAAAEVARASQRLPREADSVAVMRVRWALHEALHHLVDAAAVLPLGSPS